MDAYLPFLLVAAAAMLVPGPDTFVVLRTALADGRRSGTWAAAGSAAGNLVWGAGSVLGVAAVLAASAGAFAALKLLGAAYLMVLGARALVAAWRGELLAPADPAGPQPGRGRAFRRGLVTDLVNVKVGLFWTALVPQFVAPGTTALLPVAMVLTMGAMAFLWLAAYAAVADRLRAALTRRRVAQGLNGALGATLVGLATRLALAER